MPSKPVLSDADKENIRKKLKGLCEECWISQGYKKTSIKSLCEKAGISGFKEPHPACQPLNLSPHPLALSAFLYYNGTRILPSICFCIPAAWKGDLYGIRICEKAAQSRRNT